MTRVVDTNVPLVVKFRDQWPRELIEACEELLEEILEGGLPVVTDADGEILDEYLHQLSRSGRPTLGDAFAQYVHDRRFTWDETFRPDIEPDPSTENRYAVLGGDDEDIDPSDRKFVAAAKVAGVPVIQATDTKWLDWGAVLDRHGVEIVYVHEASIREAYRHKFGHDAP